MVQSVGILCSSGAPKKNAALLAKNVLCFGGYLHPVVVEVAKYWWERTRNSAAKGWCEVGGIRLGGVEPGLGIRR